MGRQFTPVAYDTEKPFGFRGKNVLLLTLNKTGYA